MILGLQVVQSIVKPSTEGSQFRYVEMLLQEGKAACISLGQPFYFISHGWAR